MVVGYHHSRKPPYGHTLDLSTPPKCWLLAALNILGWDRQIRLKMPHVILVMMKKSASSGKNRSKSYLIARHPTFWDFLFFVATLVFYVSKFFGCFGLSDWHFLFG